MKPLLLEAQLKTLSRVKDGSVNLGFRSQAEVSNEDFQLMDKYWQQNGWLAYKLDEIKPSDLPENNTQIKGQVSPSQYLRTRLFAKHMATGGSEDTFPTYYERAIYSFAEAVDASYEVK